MKKVYEAIAKDSEKKLKQALKLVEDLNPCEIMADELERNGMQCLRELYGRSGTAYFSMLEL